MGQTFAVCNLSIAPLRAEPSDRSEMISQLLFGDRVEILEKEEKWVKVRMAYDEYVGWIDPKQIAEIPFDVFTSKKTEPVLGLKICHPVLDTSTSQELYLMPGSSLPEFENKTFRINNTIYRMEDGASTPLRDNFNSRIEEVARFYLNAPYLWGGRSPFGIDCSGFSQIVFKQFGIPLKRDAWQQALQGELVSFLPEAQSGDLAFFENAEGRIIHVGIMLGNDQIIHAAGYVRIDPIDNEGIFNRSLNRYTHKLRIIKRYNSI